MVKLKSNVGPMKGRIGGMRVYEVNGEMIGSALPGKVKNPKTPVQMKQRIKMNNILALYSHFKTSLKNNFEGVRGNKNASSFFRSYNLMLNSVWLKENEKRWNRAVLAPYVVSMGRILPLKYEFRDGLFLTDLYVSEMPVGDDTKVCELSIVIKDNNEGWQKGDVLKLILLSQLKPEGKLEDKHLPNCLSFAFELSGSGNNLSNIPMLETNWNGERLQLQNVNGMLAVGGLDTEHYIYAFAAVHTRGEGMNVMASPQTLCLSDTTLYDSYCTEEALVAALESYKTDMEGKFLFPPKPYSIKKKP